MSIIKNGQILLYCHFNKIIKEPGASFQSPAFSQKHVTNVCHTAHYYLTKFHFDSTQDLKEICIIHYAYVVADIEICRFHKNTKNQISREQTIIFSSNKKNHSLHIQGCFTSKIVLQRRQPLITEDKKKILKRNWLRRSLLLTHFMSLVSFYTP